MHPPPCYLSLSLSLSLSLTSMGGVEEYVFVVLSPPRNVRRWVALGAAGEGNILALPHCEVTRGLLVDDVWRY